MQRWMRLACLSMLAAGCGQRRAYEINFNEDPSFQWDGKVRLVKVSEHRFGPFLTQREDSRIESITLGGRDGRAAMIDRDEVAIKTVRQGGMPLSPKMGRAFKR